ncbi:hypothetical protein [Dipodfec virus UOA04_Rod_768]|nr:hypothetical protein [Dipodfec virus UOA04_Rod_768]
MRTNVAYLFLDLPTRIEVHDSQVTLSIPVPNDDIDAPLRRFRDYAGSMPYCYTYTIDKILVIKFSVTDMISGLTLRRPTYKNNRYTYDRLHPKTPQASSKKE